jgi:hypothetical protein
MADSPLPVISIPRPCAAGSGASSSAATRAAHLLDSTHNTVMSSAAMSWVVASWTRVVIAANGYHRQTDHRTGGDRTWTEAVQRWQQQRPRR